jgi:hypothetical protein
VEIAGEAYRINTDFRAGIAYSMAAMAGEPIPMEQLLAMYFPDGIPEDRDAAMEAVNAFMACGEPPKKTEDDGPRKPPLYSYAVDAEAITAAFQHEYQIDLSAATLHWWRFRALLHGLITHSFPERVRYRAADPNKIKDKTLRSQYRRLQQLYALDAHGRSDRGPQTLEELNEMLLAQARGER